MRWRFAVVAVVVAGLGLTGAVGMATAASAAPTFKVPFPCGQVWSGQTRTNHAPANAVDFNRDNDAGDLVVASAPGTVDTVVDLGDTGYGRFVRISHGGGWSTGYAHLSDVAVTVGQRVGYGGVVGRVGSTGASTGPHLHYEQRSGGTDVRITFNGAPALYWGTRSYTSDNACGTGGGIAATVDTAGAPLTVRSGPGTGFDPVGTLADGSRVTVFCQTAGTAVTGTFGTSVVWNRIGAGRYVADAYVRTGSDGYVPGLPRC